MPSTADDAGTDLTAAERERLRDYRNAQSLAALVELTGTDDLEEGYYDAKDEWRRLRDRELPPASESADELPADAVVVDGHEFRVHGVTHANTGSERAFLRDHVGRFLERGETVYCEQGIRHMYFPDAADVCEMDDYRWALAAVERLGTDPDFPTDMEALADIDSVSDRVRETVFALVESGSEVYGERFSRALGDVAASFLTDDTDVATGEDYESFALSRRAAEDPSALGALQRYYKCAFLPQPLERQWLRRHDPQLEVVSHARNERMADYAVYHNEDVETVHLLVGAAHQPGVRYYLEAHRDGRRDLSQFELA